MKMHTNEVEVGRVETEDNTDTGTQNRCLLHKPYVNEVNLSRQNPPLKCRQLLELFTQFQRDLHFSMLKLWNL